MQVRCHLAVVFVSQYKASYKMIRRIVDYKSMHLFQVSLPKTQEFYPTNFHSFKEGDMYGKSCFLRFPMPATFPLYQLNLKSIVIVGIVPSTRDNGVALQCHLQWSYVARTGCMEDELLSRQQALPLHAAIQGNDECRYCLGTSYVERRRS